MKISNLVQTCPACPSQWGFDTDNKRRAYVRYRWGWLGVYVSEPGEEETEILIYEARIGDEFHGHIEWEEVLSRIADLDIEATILAQRPFDVSLPEVKY